MYKHRQTGTPLLLILGCFMGMGALVLIFNFTIRGLIAEIVLLMIILLFNSLLVIVDKEKVVVHFGLRFIKKTIPVKEIDYVSVSHIKWWKGLGMRKIIRGWMVSVSGRHAVDIVRKNDKIFRIGTDEPEKLEAAIKEVI